MDGYQPLLCYASIAFLVFAYPGFILVKYYYSVGREPTSDEQSKSSSSSSSTDISVTAIPRNSKTSSGNEIKNGLVREKAINNNNNPRGWKCACETGGIFLPQSLMKSIGGPAAAFKMGSGGCYHKEM